MPDEKDLKTADGSDYDEAALAVKVADKMNEVFGSEETPTEETPTEETPTEETPTEETPTEETPTEETPTEETPTEETPTEETEAEKVIKAAADSATSEDEKKTDDETLTLPASHIQTALRLGMSEDEVKKLFDENPEFMISAMGKLHAGENTLSAKFAQLGRAEQQRQASEHKPQTKEDGAPVKSFVDMKDLKSKFDADDVEMNALIDGVIAPLNEALTKMQEQLDTQAQSSGKPAFVQEEQALHSEINNFFDNDQLKEFRDYYGTVKPGEDPREVLTGAQFAHRGKTCNEGNLIRIGASVSGDELTVSDVLQRAHLQLTESMRGGIIREDITSKIKTRAKSLSIKVGTKKVPSSYTPKNAEKELEVKTKARLAKVFGSR